MINFKLAPNFSLYELTRTGRKGFVQLNREGGIRKLYALVLLANLLQRLRDHLGFPLIVSSGFRSDELNKKLKGSRTSQHRKGEAADFSPVFRDPESGEIVGDHRDRAFMRHCFLDCVQFLKANGIMFGQFIFEEETKKKTKKKPKTVKRWFHLSLGAPFRPLDKCGQVMRYLDGDYSMTELVEFSKWYSNKQGRKKK